MRCTIAITAGHDASLNENTVEIVRRNEHETSVMSVALTPAMSNPRIEGTSGAALLSGRSSLTLRTKGILALLAMVMYVAAFAFYVANDRQKLLHIVQQQEQIYERQQALIKIDVAITRSLVELRYLLNSKSNTAAQDNVLIDLGVIKAGLPEMKERYPDIADNVARFERTAADLCAAWSPDRLTLLRDAEQALGARLEQLESGLADQHIVLAARYRAANHNVFVVWVISSFLGVTLFGAIVTFFFTKLAADIKALESRAIAIVGGYRGPPLIGERGDEVGGLMRAVNRMQSELRHWEQQQELSRQQRFHQEKMAAVGSLAAAVAHEVNNPIAAIAGIAQHLIELHATRGEPGDEACGEHAKVILRNTERIGSIMRQVANVASYRSPDPELLDLNSVIQATCGFISYDQRFCGIELTTSLSSALPAIRAVADHVTQVLVNLLINAADSMEGVGGRKPTINVSTCRDDGAVMLFVKDNGCGMGQDVLAQAFKEFFTTKSAEKGRGIGLFLCQMLMEKNGGRVQLESTPGIGTTACVILPPADSQFSTA